MASLKKGDRVRWQTSQGPTTGTVVQRRTKGYDPAYIVESESSGKRAAHKQDALTKV